jgi:hypothetical protein
MYPISVCKDYNIKHHYNIHVEIYDMFVVNIREQIEWFEVRSYKQQNIFQLLSKVNRTAVKASYALSNLIASNSKPFSDRQFIKECLIKPAKIMSPVSLTWNTVADCIDDIVNNLRIQLCNVWKHFEAATYKNWTRGIEFEKIFCNLENYKLKFVIFSKLFTFDVEKAVEHQMELCNWYSMWLSTQKYCKIGVPNFYSFLPREERVNNCWKLFKNCSKTVQKLLNLRTKYVQCLAAHVCVRTVVFMYEMEQNMRDHGWRTCFCHRLWRWFPYKI